MEKLKSLIPINLKQRIFESTSENLPSTCSSLIEFFLTLPEFQRVVRELSDPEMALCRKNVASALDSKQKGNECFSSGDFSKALSFYTQKLGLLEECIRDCNRAVGLFPHYAKAWYRRGKAYASLKKYEDAICDFNVALSMEGSLDGKSRIKDELEIMLNYCKRKGGTSSSCNKENEKDLCSRDRSYMTVEPHQIKLQCISTSAKGRGMSSPNNIDPASLVHSEEPFAAVILKQCRETHCHCCFNELPADTIPCSSCTIPLYCSQRCQEQASGKLSEYNQSENNIHEILSLDLERDIMDTTLASNVKHDQIPEHRHECGGIHWAAILPPEIVLAGRVLVKSIEKRRCSKETFEPMDDLELSHNYTQIPLESKLELHIHSIVLAYCLQHSYGSAFPFTGASASQLVILISQIKVNSMAIVHMKSLDAYGALGQSGKLSAIEDALISNVEQVRVGQAIYSKGSLFNHSCQPNIHTYFLSRTLFIRSTEFIPAGVPLELSYGPQVGQWDLRERQQLLEDQYSFKCQCSGCSQLNLSDIVIHAFQCVRPDCFGVVLNSSVVKHGKLDASCVHDFAAIDGLERALPVVKHEQDTIDKVAHLLLKQSDGLLRVGPGYCLTCGSYRDLESSFAATKKAVTNIKRLQATIISKKVSTILLSDALKSRDLLRSTMHAYSKDVAQAEDNLAEAFCLVGEFQLAMNHCTASIEILEKLYHKDHIVIGNELMKLASIQLSLHDLPAALSSINRLDAIFSLYYGSHAARLFPYLENLRREANKLAL
ncbi:tetratricopeptide repeat (TPR)-like superfamily protein isoform X2 [Tasmannia lanceolata]|uniref:tetratricopeptide repeat (TPR)-like superfamily protein isoform X2 n=1 Tax=Tasmannia lanceolata TaxID=3420 RepID=UPI0040645B6E